jgi:hypothetical protein
MLFTPKRYNTYEELRAERYDRLDSSNTEMVTEDSDAWFPVFGWVGNEVFRVSIEYDFDELITYVVSNPFPRGLEHKNMEIEDGNDVDLCWSIIAEAQLG